MLAVLVSAALAATTTTTTPAPTAASHFRWNKAVRIEAAQLGGVDAVSCASAALCVAVDQAGNVLTSTHPTGGNGSWSGTGKIDTKAALTGVSCPVVSLCVAVDAAGDVLTTTRPTGGASAWSKPLRIDANTVPGGGPAGLTGISCPTTTLCVAVDGATKGNVLVSTKPTGGPAAWSLAAIAIGPLTSISCASTTLCVVAGNQHYVSTDPLGGAKAWKGTGPEPGAGIFSAIDCLPSACVAVGYGNTSVGLATSTAKPLPAAHGIWKTVEVEATPPVPGEGLLDAVGCPNANLCVAIDANDNSYASTAPIGGAWSAGGAIRPLSASTANAISCTPTLCVVVDSAGVETTAVVH